MERTSAKRWVYLTVGTVMLLCLGLLYAWSIFRIPLKAMFPGWTATQISMTFTISMIFFCLGGSFSGKLRNILQGRYIVLIAAGLLLVGFWMVSTIDATVPGTSLQKLYVFYGICCGTGVGMAYNSIISTVTKWFPDNMGLASGILLMGFGLGGLLLGSVVNAVIGIIGLTATFFRLAILIAIVLAIGSFFIRMPAAVSAEVSDAASGSENGCKEKRREYTVGQMLQTPAFWVAFLWFTIISAAGLMIINSAATIAVAFGASAVFGLAVSIFNGAGRVTMGTLFDKIGRHKSMMCNSLIMLLGGSVLFCGAMTTGILLIFLGLMLIGIGYGGSPALTSAVINGFFGSENYPVNFSVANFCLIPAALFGPLISSKLQDLSGGSYGSTFVMIMVFGLIAFILNLVLRGLSKELE
ncbi:MAG: MFS transporter [Spirochaetia bacterium]|jgi:OFA family oxalate/formate antiporter-like MFS transporter|nr:MFS transporter [Spirochaetia bacterium]